MATEHEVPTRVARHPAALWRRTLAGTIVLGPGHDEPKLLEPPGDAIWAALADPVSPRDLVARLSSTFDAPADVVHDDVARFLADLIRLGVVIQVDRVPNERRPGESSPGES